MLRELPNKTPPKYLPDRPKGLRNLDIAFVSIRACYSYNKRNYDMFQATVEDIDRIL